MCLLGGPLTADVIQKQTLFIVRAIDKNGLVEIFKIIN